MQELVDSTDRIGDVAALRAALDRDGYLFFRGLLPRERVLRTREEVLGGLHELGWLREGEPIDRAAPSEKAVPEGREPRDAYFEAYTRVQRIQSFHELAHEAAVLGLLEELFGETVVVQPMKIMRLGVPTGDGWTTPSHQDFPIIDGTVDFVTGWIPLGDCSRALGGLKVLHGSHRDGRREVLHGRGVGGFRCDVDEDDERFCTTDYRAGDVLVFHSLTVHGAIPNTTDSIRLSADFRYQALTSPMRIHMLNPHYAPFLPGWEELTEGWTSDRSWRAPDGVVIHPEGEHAPVTPKLVTLDT